jgi:hypothetical protein
MRCHVTIPLGQSGYATTSCYEPLREDGTCPIHGQQVMVRPEWMAEEKWKKWLDKNRVRV